MSQRTLETKSGIGTVLAGDRECCSAPYTLHIFKGSRHADATGVINADLKPWLDRDDLRLRLESGDEMRITVRRASVAGAEFQDNGAIRPS